MKVLFVCWGNICRSPMAAELMRTRLAEAGLGHVIVESAGLLGLEGRRAAPEAIEVLREIGVDLSVHRSRGLRPQDLRTADLVIAMERAHLESMAREARPGGGERRLLRAFESAPRPAPDPPDLDDPIGLPIELFRAQRDTIGRCIDHLVLRLKHPP